MIVSINKYVLEVLYRVIHIYTVYYKYSYTLISIPIS